MSNHSSSSEEESPEQLDPNPSLDRQKSPNLATCFGIDSQHDHTLMMHLGSEMVRVTCQRFDEKPKSRVLDLPKTVPVHKALLCRYSRHFYKELGKPFEDQMIVEALKEIDKCKDHYLSYGNFPAGYVPSPVAKYEEYAKQDGDQEVGDIQRPAQELKLIVDEHPSVFAVVVHWLYTQELKLQFLREATVEERYAQVYALAERLDFPSLRRQCYKTLTEEYYYSTECLPDLRVAEIIIKECSPDSLLGRYIIAMLAYVMIDDESKEFKGTAKSILALDKGFAALVAEEVMRRLGSEEGSVYPCDHDKYESDDSDSEVSSSIDIGSDIAYDSEGDVSETQSVDNESLVAWELGGDAAKPPAVEADEVEVENDGDQSDPDNGESPIAHASVTPEPQTSREVKSEDVSPLRSSVNNKRKRMPSETRPGKSKRVQTPEETEFMDLTNSP